MDRIDEKLAAEAKAIVALAFRNGPIEDVHAVRSVLTAMTELNTHVSQRLR